MRVDNNTIPNNMKANNLGNDWNQSTSESVEPKIESTILLDLKSASLISEDTKTDAISATLQSKEVEVKDLDEY